jgi:hypothetical protein
VPGLVCPGATEDAAARRVLAGQTRPSGAERVTQYVLSWGCHLVMVTGFQSTLGPPSTQLTSVCFR